MTMMRARVLGSADMMRLEKSPETRFLTNPVLGLSRPCIIAPSRHDRHGPADMGHLRLRLAFAAHGDRRRRDRTYGANGIRLRSGHFHGGIDLQHQEMAVAVPEVGEWF